MRITDTTQTHRTYNYTYEKGICFVRTLLYAIPYPFTFQTFREVPYNILTAHGFIFR